MGLVTPLGLELDSFWDHLIAGRSAVRRIERFDPSSYPTRIAAEVSGSLLEDCAPDLRDYGTIARFAATAAATAIEDSCLLSKPADRSRIGVLVAAGLGSYDHEEVFASCASAGSRRAGEFDWETFAKAVLQRLKSRSLERRSPGTVPSLIAHRHGFEGPVMTVMTACAAGAQALGDAARWIRSGLADVVVAGGSDSELYPMGLASFCMLGALSTSNHDPTGASRPFDARRDGFVIGEGAGISILEERSHALKRGARIYAEVAGFGSACDAYRVTDPHPLGTGAVLSMRRALKDASIAAGEVQYINAHGTSTQANDRIETFAIKNVLGDAAKKVAVSSTKSMIGHLTVAAGAVEAITTALTLFHQQIHPTINLCDPDPDCDLDYVPNRPRIAEIRHALSNSFGFGGQCASLLLRRYEG
jgi:3-oxoacyl-[acyl-carrier-protein] synthase II